MSKKWERVNTGFGYAHPDHPSTETADGVIDHQQDEIEKLRGLLSIFTKHMTMASQAWFPKPMIEAKKKTEELLNE